MIGLSYVNHVAVGISTLSISYAVVIIVLNGFGWSKDWVELDFRRCVIFFWTTVSFLMCLFEVRCGPRINNL